MKTLIETKFHRLLLAAALIFATKAPATVLIFDRINYNPPGGFYHVLFPENYGDRVTSDSYIPPNYTSYPDNTWFYGIGGGHTPNIVADYRIRNDSATVEVSAVMVGDLFEVVMGAAASVGEQFIEVSLTADPGYLAHLESFNLANIVGPRLLPHLQVTSGVGTVLFSANDVPINGGPAGTHSTFDNGGAGWTAQKLVIRLDAPFDVVLAATDFVEAQNRHISRYGIDNISFSQVASLAATAPPPATVQCGDPLPAVATDLASFVAQGGSASGGCASLAVAQVGGDVPTGSCPKIIARTYRVTDACGSHADCTQSITVQDTTPPTIGAPGPDATIECPAALAFTAPTTASDTCDPSPQIIEVSDSTIPGACAGAYTRTKTWHAVDACGNASTPVSQTITVRDTTPPTISSHGADATIECPALPSFTPPTATDTCDSNPQIVEDSDVTKPGACAGAYERTKTWHAVDACGNASAPVSQTITVKDVTAPVIGAAGADATIECPATPVFSSPTATDTCDPSPQIVEVSDNTTPGACASAYTRTKTWRAVDACGNASETVSQTITVQDTTPPTMTCPDNIMIVTGPGLAWYSVFATDNSSAPVITVDPPSGSTFAMGRTPVTCRATDRCGNTATCTFYVTVTAFGCTSANQQAYVKALTTEAGDHFGYSVAVDGDTMVVGAPGEGDGAGAAYIFVRDGSGNWSQQAHLKASNPDANDNFGWSVAISGNTIVVGAPAEDGNATGVPGANDCNHNGMPDEVDIRNGVSLDVDGNGVPDECEGSLFHTLDSSGAAYVFVRSGPIWSQQAYLKASNSEAGDIFGWSVGISGETVIVGATQEDSSFRGVQSTSSLTPEQADNSAVSSGAAYVFVRSGSIWSQQAYLKASNSEAGDIFGWSLAISGETVIVGATQEDSSFRGVQSASSLTPEQADNTALDSGAAYVMTLVNEPCARDDTFVIPTDAPLIIPIGALLGNDAHSRGLPIYFIGADAATTHGAAIMPVGSPTVTALTSHPNPADLTEDTFTYRITDGVHETSGTVHLLPVAIPTAPTPNKLGFIPSAPGARTLAIAFNAPAAGTYVLERQTIGGPASGPQPLPWSPIATAWPTGPGVTAFTDAMLPSGALYRVRRVP
jgi:hypothetical protein